MRNLINPTKSEIVQHITNMTKVGAYADYIYVILGRSGPTGKTTLCKYLKESGLKAIEISESIYMLVEYCDDSNHFIVDDMHKEIVIVLNRSVKE